MTTHLRILRPAPNIYAFYDGRVEGYRFAEGENWVDDGALSLGIASHAIVDGEDEGATAAQAGSRVQDRAGKRQN